MIRFLLVLLFVVLPLVELALLIAIGRWIGFWNTLGIVVLTGFLGAALVRHQSRAAWADIRQAWQAGRVPAPELVAGALFLVGATFLLTPGVITDAAGFLLLVPPVRRATARGLVAYFAARTVSAAGPRQARVHRIR